MGDALMELRPSSSICSGWFICLWIVGLVCGCDRVARPSSAVIGVSAGRPTATGTQQADEIVTRLESANDSFREDDWFEDVTERSSIRFVHRNGREAGRYYLIESFGGGAAAVDYDRDGDCDLFITGGGTISPHDSNAIAGLPCALFRNRGDWKFDDSTSSAGLDLAHAYSQGCAATDFDLDGFPDLFVCGYGRSRLYRNLGDGTYGEVDHWAELPAIDWTTAAAFADFDHDGAPDLIVARYASWSPESDVKCSTRGIRDLCGPSSYEGTSCQAFRNCGNGQFEDWSSVIGMKGNIHGLAVVAADLNLDGWVDFYIAGDVTPNQLYLGGPQMPLKECGIAAGVALNEWGQAEGSMGVDIADFDGDGRPDIWVTNFEQEDNALYRSLNDGLFLHASAAVGLSGVSRMRVGFGTAMTDFDGDGWPDLFVLNGNPIYSMAQTPFQQRSQFFRNLGGRRFEEVSDRAGSFFREVHSGRGSAVADLDNDGALDVIAVSMNEPVRILRNRQTPANFVRVQLAARGGEPDATGARLWMEYQGRRLTQFVTRGTGFFSQSDSRILFPATSGQSVVDVTVQWPSRGSEVFRDLKVCASHILIEGRGETVRD